MPRLVVVDGTGRDDAPRGLIDRRATVRAEWCVSGASRHGQPAASVGTPDERRCVERAAPPMTWTPAIIDYGTALRARGLSPYTQTLYRHYLNHAAGRIGGDPWKATGAQLEQLIGMPERGPAARKSRRTALAGFYRWGLARGHVETNPVDSIPVPKVPQGRPRPTPDGLIAEALALADARERLMIELGALAGLRAGEIAQVHRDDLLDGDVLLVHGKGGKTRRVPLVNGELVQAIRSAGDEGWLFPNVQRGGHLTANRVSKLLSQGLPGAWTGHTLRHRFGTRAYAATRDLLAVSELLGHASPVTTRIYVQMPDDHLRTAVAAAATIGTVALVGGGCPAQSSEC